MGCRHEMDRCNPAHAAEYLSLAWSGWLHGCGHDVDGKGSSSCTSLQSRCARTSGPTSMRPATTSRRAPLLTHSPRAYSLALSALCIVMVIHVTQLAPSKACRCAT